MAFATNLPTLHNDPSMRSKGHIFQEAIDISNLKQFVFYYSTVKVGFKERINREQVGVSEQFWDDQKVPYYRPCSI